MVLKDGEVMSKSKGNTVDPDAMIQKYGADTLRLFILFAAPPEDQLEWNDSAMEGSWRFLNRVWNLAENRFQESHTSGASLNDADKELERERHAAIKKVTNDIENGFKFNTAISSIMIFVNKIEKSQAAPQTINEAVKTLFLFLPPFVPHLGEERGAKK